MLPRISSPRSATAFQADLCVVSGGLGPTHDDRTVEMVARAAGTELVVDEDLESRDRGRLAVVRGTSRQAVRRLRARSTEAGHAPGGSGVDRAGRHGTRLCVATYRAPSWSCCPGHPGSSSGCGRPRLASEPVRDVLERARHRERRTLRLYGVSESSVARTLHEAGGDGDGLDVTVCARDFEIHVDALAEPGAEVRAETLFGALRAEHERHVFAEDGRPVEEIVLGLCRALGLTLATAESCTGGLVGERLTSVPGASDVYLGGVVAYADSVKEEQLGVSGDLLREHGAVSAEAAAAMAQRRP